MENVPATSRESVISVASVNRRRIAPSDDSVVFCFFKTNHSLINKVKFRVELQLKRYRFLNRNLPRKSLFGKFDNELV